MDFFLKVGNLTFVLPSQRDGKGRGKALQLKALRGITESTTVEGRMFKCDRCDQWVDVESDSALESAVHAEEKCSLHLVKGILEA